MSGSEGLGGSPRACAARVVRIVTKSDRFSRDVIDDVLTKSSMSAPDRRFCTELSYGALRWFLPLSATIKKGFKKPNRRVDPDVMAHLVVAAYQLHHLSERVPPHAAVDEAVKLVTQHEKRLTGFANAILRNLAAPPHLALSDASTDKDIGAAYGIPDALLDAVPAGPERLQRIAAMNGRPRRGLYTLSGEPSAELGLTPHPFVPRAFLSEGFNENVIEALKHRKLMVQDPGSALVVELARPNIGKRVLDMCAAPGTKARGLYAGLADNGGGDLVAVDIRDKRARKIHDHFNKDDAVEVIVGDARDTNIVPGDDFDTILLDAPCTGFGTTRRRPEIKMRREKADDGLLASQWKLLDAAVKRLRPDGSLVYAVCSPLAAEGPEQIRSFLKRHTEFHVVPANTLLPKLPASAVDERGCVRLNPYDHEADAFFAARLERKS